MPRGPGFYQPSEPSSELLQSYAPSAAWEQARRQAQRSPMGYYRTGAVLIDRHGEILALGCAHPSPEGGMASTHAERHCLLQVPNLDLRRSSCLIYTRSSRSGGCAWSSRPCLHCAWALAKRGVQQAIYPRRGPQGQWEVEIDDLSDLSQLQSAGRRLVKGSRFARALSR
jgi:tRNA(Arg) A34 adenosine deaminase TadA